MLTPRVSTAELEAPLQSHSHVSFGGDFCRQPEIAQTSSCDIIERAPLFQLFVLLSSITVRDACIKIGVVVIVVRQSFK